MLAGASAVQVGTASYFDPVATETLVEELTTTAANTASSGSATLSAVC
jgi:dihydroorotate dehydrogenase